MIPKSKIIRAREIFKRVDKSCKNLWSQLFFFEHRLREILDREDAERVEVCWRCKKEIKKGNHGMERHYERKHPDSQFYPRESELLKELVNLKAHLQEAFNRVGFIESNMPKIPDLRRKEFRKSKPKLPIGYLPSLPKNVVVLRNYSRQEAVAAKKISRVHKPKMRINLRFDSRKQKSPDCRQAFLKETHVISTKPQVPLLRTS